MAKTETGIVVSNKMKNTVVVKVNTKIKHPLYKKLITRTKKYKAHDESGVEIGQTVKITETKPYSKGVHFKVVEGAK